MEKINPADAAAKRYSDIEKSCAEKSKWADLSLIFALGAVSVLTLLLVWLAPQKSFSEDENRYLQTRENIDHAELADQISAMYADQFPFRREIIKAKAYAELALGKGENNGILVREDTLAARSEYSAAEKKTLLDNVSAIKRFSAILGKDGASICFAVAPRGADMFFADRAHVARGWELLFGTDHIDLRASVKAHGNEYVWFRTDHHWTPLGAYYAYCALSGALGYEALPISDFRETLVSDEFFGTAWSKSGAYLTPPDKIYAFFGDDDGSYYIYDKLKGKKLDFGLYDRSKLPTKDKYSFFLGGDHGHIQISNGKEKPHLLVIKDSYFNSIAPFLCRHFELDVIDLRYFSGSVCEYAKDRDLKNILILCGLDSLASAPTFTALLYKSGE